MGGCQPPIKDQRSNWKNVEKPAVYFAIKMNSKEGSQAIYTFSGICMGSIVERNTRF